MPKKPSAERPSKTEVRKRAGPKLAWLLLLVAAAGGGAILFTRQHPGNSHPGSQVKPGKVQPVVEPEAQAYAGYAGSASCKNCHEEAYELWAASNHGQAERRPSPGLDQDAFEPARTFHHGTQMTSVRHQGDRYQIVCVGLAKQPETNIVARVIG